MKVVLDSKIFALQKYGGISRYFITLVQEINRLQADVDMAVCAPLHINEYLDALGDGQCRFKIPYFPGSHKVLGVLNRKYCSSALKRQRPDIVHETYYSAAPLVTNRPAVLTVFDMIHEKYPDLFHGVDCQVAQAKEQAVRRADAIICISEQTKQDLSSFYDISPAKIEVVHLANSLNDTIKSRSVAHDVEQKPFLLYVGRRQGVKNFSALLEAFASSPSLKNDFCLYCVGGGEFSLHELQAMERLGVRQHINYFDGDDALLISLYKHAVALLYPSLYEGFGLPLLEAMHFGCPVICSSVSSIPEVAGDAAAFFDPLDKENICHVLQNTLYSQDELKRLKERGKKREQTFSWQRCAQETLNVYRQVV